ncbi:phosphate ABC transporter substrate-binding/OmpA family protein [Pseudoruegeria sp. SHC-113]|uniref:phosphate ABC transporter substrate-binding/OmpA family protein n=1 Tax=Pseudoruegeria sp. SHC-113 TaxID=2855439 RepID=UPI0021BA57B2|nr:phosphate ABC transporter substrate-binding/OmpA family protein [Pseudoruegeria sp. SHC-113]MCT8158526.1 substrate-binding domain-containing protein [Pseudoruegeria sp. SHC-113]
MRMRRAAVSAALFLFTGLLAPAVAQDVTLSARGGGLSVSGTLLSFDGEFYRVQTEFGPLTLDGSGVDCAGPGCPDLENFVARITVAGDAMLGAELMPLLLESYAGSAGLSIRRIVSDDRNFHYVLWQEDSGTPVAEIAFHLGTTAQGFGDLFTDQADIVMAAREITPDELVAAREAGLPALKSAARGRVVALDGLVPLVAAENPVAALSLEQLVALRGGEITNWADLGGIDAPVVLHALTADSGVEEAIAEKIAPLGPVAVTRHRSLASLADAVARDPLALGFGTLTEQGNARTLGLLGACGRGFAASAHGLKAEDYPLTLPLLLYTPPRRLPKFARGFLRYLGTAPAQALVRANGFVDLAAEREPLAIQGERLAGAILNAGSEVPLSELQRMVARLAGYERLTTTFRFETGSSVLDAQSRTNVLLLAEALEAGAYDGQRLMFVGFSDGDGAAASNRQISQNRARRVMDAVRRAAPALPEGSVLMATEAFGEALPMACDDSALGRQINRRVEVWAAPATP